MSDGDTALHWGSEAADWWDRQAEESREALGQFVDRYPNVFGVTVAALTDTAITLGSGFVDLARLGEGIRKGTLGGVGEDGLRLLGLATPGLGRIAKAGAGRLAKLVSDQRGPICAWIAATKVLRHTSTRLFATLDDVARAAGVPVSKLGGATMSETVGTLRKLGARVSDLGRLGTLEAVKRAVASNRGVVMFTVKWTRNGEKVGHMLYAFRDRSGVVRIADRTGAVIDSLFELQRLHPGYGAIGSAVVGKAVVVRDMTVTLLRGAAYLAAEVRVGSEYGAQTLDLVLDSFSIGQSFRGEAAALTPMSHDLDLPSRGAAGRSVAPRVWSPEMPYGIGTHRVRSGETLWEISADRLGDGAKWPLLYFANPDAVGDNPDRLREGTTLVVPTRVAGSFV